MFDQMRRNTKTILWITVIAFVGLIFLAWGADFSLGDKKKMDPGTIGSVNGTPIYARTYDALVSQNRQSYQQQQAGRDIDERTEVMIRNQTWDNLVQDTLLREEAKRRGITVTDQEVVQAVLTQPPPDVMQNPGFQTNGQFDLAKYQAALRDPNVDTRALEQQYRSNLPLQKLQMQIIGSVTVSDADLWDAYQAQNDRAKVAYARIPAGKFTVDEGSISQQQMEQYLQSHRESYKLPRQADVQYVQIPLRYTEQDSLNLIDQAKQIVQDAKNEEFSGLVDAYSEAAPATRGGADGMYLTEAQISDPGVRAAAFSLPVGGMSDVIASPNGLHVIKVVDRKADPAGDSVKFADIFMSYRPSPETISTLRDKIVQFRTDAEKADFAQTAGTLNLQVKDTGMFGEAGYIPGLGSSPEVLDFAFSVPVGTVSQPIEKPEGWIVVKLKDRKDPHTAALSEVEARVRTEVADSLRVDQAAQVASRLLSAAQAGTPVDKLASLDPRAEAGSTDAFGRLGFPQGIGSDPAVVGPIFAAPGPGLIPKVLRGRSAAYVVQVLERTPADRNAFEAQKNQLRNSLIQRRQNQLFTEWLTTLKRSAKIEDYRFGRFDI